VQVGLKDRGGGRAPDAQAADDGDPSPSWGSSLRGLALTLATTSTTSSFCSSVGELP
jgi:hypothetical protein